MMLTKYIESKIDGKTYNRQNGHFTKHLRLHSITYQDYYETYITGKKEFCSFCGKSCHLNQAHHTYTDTCGSKPCVNKNVSKIRLAEDNETKQKINEKRRKTVVEKYGVEYTAQIEEVKQKILIANDVIVCDGKTSKQIQQEKTKETKLDRYGDAFYNNSNAIAVAMSKHSIDKKNNINDKRRKTNLERFGYETILLSPDVVSKINRANATLKKYVFPSGTEINLQGYEHWAVDKLLKIGYTEREIIISNPYKKNIGIIIEYTNLNRSWNKYYPDIYIPKENRLIEVKSRWWFDGNGGDKYKSRYENNMRKKEAAIKAGYKFEFWVFENKKEYKIIK